MIDLSTWNLSIPEGSPAVTIDTPSLAQGFKDQYFHADTGTLFFWAPVTGSKTANAIYPRSELRETYSSGAARNWLYSAADNKLSATLTVNQVPSTGKVVIGQIHTKDSTSPLIKLEYQYKTKTSTGNIVAKVRMHPEDADGQVIIVATGIKLNQPFSYLIHLDKAGVLTVNGAGYQWSSALNTAWANKQLYFKAGVYVQDNTGYVTEGGQVTFSLLNIAHTL
ncbi:MULTISPECIES: polysaccharide lyase family 7 protein [Pseudomonas]|uniref:polysaccharide lyase family 7 protein n=1 Tax=Pseudomonas TaxID=286 RepID=UPI001BE9127B|nr:MULTISPECIES: polysaccharide lyase family 7 protein [Pseudomonas]MBT2342410.1 polysaccharide lyase family 7 protein [Pseudomonas fluorescens]MCD4532397.1 polysaccharide lyase family 7 protein [Pseudomonas sp. C3-2018]